MTNAAEIPGCICYIRSGSAMKYQVWAYKYMSNDINSPKILIRVNSLDCQLLNRSGYAFKLFFTRKPIDENDVVDLLKIENKRFRHQL